MIIDKKTDFSGRYLIAANISYLQYGKLFHFSKIPCGVHKNV
jgi:hypothetical protein